MNIKKRIIYGILVALGGIAGVAGYLSLGISGPFLGVFGIAGISFAIMKSQVVLV